MAKEDKFIVAVVLGSSKISAVAGIKEPDGAIKILAHVQESSAAFIRKGRVNNVNKMKACIASIKEKLEKKLQKGIGSVYVGIGGMGVHSVSNKVVRHFAEKTTITQEIVNDMKQSNLTTSTNEQDILESVVLEFKLGTQQTSDPVGIPCESIEARFLNIVGNSSIREDIRNCFKEVGLRVIKMPISVQALADAILNDTEKSSGCVLVDMGAETTTVAVYKNRLLRHMAVLPLGSANVNRDITSLQIEDPEAEELKKKYGQAIYDNNETKQETLTLNDGRTIPFTDFSALVEARVEEIIMNIDNQVKLSKYDKNSLIGGLFLTGGASEMKGLEQAFRTYTEFVTLKQKKEVSLPLRGNNIGDLKKDAGFITALAIIDQAVENCCIGDLGETNINLFEEENKRKEAEAAAAAAAEEAAQKAQEEQQKEGNDSELSEENENTEKEKKESKFKTLIRKLTDLVSE